MSAVSIVNLVIHKGTDFEETFYFTAEDGDGLNLLNTTATAKIKKHPASQDSYNFTTALTVSDSSVKVSMADTITSTLPSGRCMYDIVLTGPDGFKTKIVEGNVLVQETISL